MKNLHMIAHIILSIMGINVGLSLLNIDLVGMVTNAVPMLSMIWVIAVGLSGLYCAYFMVTNKCCK